MSKLICTVTNDLTYDRRMKRICRSLSDEGYEVTLVGRHLPDSARLQKEPFKQHRISCRFHSGKAFYLEYNLRLFRYLLAESPDILCAVDLDTLLPCLRVGAKLGKPCVYDAHEYFTEVPEIVSRPVIKWVWEQVAAFGIPKVDAAYTVGQCLARQFEKRYGKHFSVVRNLPIHRETAISHEVPARPILLYQGALNEGRGLEAAISAMRQLDSMELWIAGEGDLSQQFRQLAVDQEVVEKVKFLGYVLPAQLGELADKATLGLNLLENKGLSYYYSAANKAFDYIQAGLPSVQMAFPEYVSLNEEFGVFELLEGLDHELLAGKISSLLGDPSRYSAMAANCRKAAEELHWKKEEQKLLAVYQALGKQDKA